MTHQSDPMDHLGRYDDRDDAPTEAIGPLGTSHLLDHLDADEPEPGVSLSRRGLLTGVGAAVGAAVAGGSLWRPARSAQAHGTIEVYPGIWGQRTVSEGSGNLASFGYRPSFHDRCSSWLEFWHDNTPSFWNRPYRVWTYGVHTDSRVSEAHNAGRGFDITRITVVNNSGDRVRRFFARYDIWKDWADADRRLERRRYWATAASLHHHFRSVLTYYYNADHHNHIHFDNLESGAYNSNFSTGSRAQVQHVQACLRWIWGKGTSITGGWNAETNNHSHDVLVRIGKGGYLTSSKSHWLAFNRATCRKGYGVQDY